MIRMCSLFIALALAVLAAGGCGGTAEPQKRLTAELPHFISQYIKNEFAKQIKLNSQSNAFLMSENKLLLLEFDGIDVIQRQAPHNDLLEMAVARCYAGQELNIICRKAAWSSLTEVSHERFKYRALITLDFTDTRRMWQRVPGCNVVMTVFKNEYTPDKLKEELLNRAAGFLPPEKFDFNAIYNRPSSVNERNFTATFFVCYDPALPGWVPEDSELLGNKAVAAPAPDWLTHTLDKASLAKGVEIYNGDLYWANTRNIRQNYDNGLIFFNNKWMSPEEAEENIKLNAAVDKFDPNRASIDDLTAFLQQLKSFSAKMDLTNGMQKAMRCAENHINSMSGGDNYRSLENFLMLMQKNPAYSDGFELLKESASQALLAAKRRINRQLDNAASDIKNALTGIMKLKNSSLTCNQINIECVRQDNVLKKVCARDSEIISRQLFRLRFLVLLNKRQIEEVNKLYKYNEYRDLLKSLEETVIRNCKNCRKGVQNCIYCAKAPGVCSSCHGLRPSEDSEACTLCKNSGACSHCRGSARMKCMNCQGRGFVVLFASVEVLCEQAFAELENILKSNITELENRKLAL